MTTASLVGFVDLRDPDRSIEQQQQPFIEDYNLGKTHKYKKQYRNAYYKE